MKTSRFLLALGFAAVLAGPVLAGILFGKSTKPSPAEQVSRLLLTLKTDSEEHKRASAAKELRDFDPKTFPEMIPILIDVLKQDPKASVRTEVVQTLGKLRPISQEAGMALEAGLNDASWRVRWQARQSLLGYRMSGYKSPPKADAASLPAPPTGKQNTNSVPPAPPGKRGVFSTAPKHGPGIVPNETPPPPLADPLPATPKSGPVPRVSPRTPPVRPTPTPSDEGPDLPLGNGQA